MTWKPYFAVRFLPRKSNIHVYGGNLLCIMDWECYRTDAVACKPMLQMSNVSTVVTLQLQRL